MFDWQKLSSLVLLAAVLSGHASPALCGDEPKAIKAGASQDTFSLGTAQLVLAWEKWHKRVTRALTKNLRAATPGVMGSVRIRVAINKDRHLTAQLIESDFEGEIGKGCVDAVNKLDGEEVLAFPDGTKREQITFDFTFKRAPMMFPKHDYIKDDFEKVED